MQIFLTVIVVLRFRWVQAERRASAGRFANTRYRTRNDWEVGTMSSQVAALVFGWLVVISFAIAESIATGLLMAAAVAALLVFMGLMQPILARAVDTDGMIHALGLAYMGIAGMLLVVAAIGGVSWLIEAVRVVLGVAGL